LETQRRPGESVIRWVLRFCGLLSIFTTLGILYVLLSQTILFFQEVPISDFLLDTQWTPLFTDKHFGIWPLVSGTILISVIALAFAIPFGIMAAVYLSEYASTKARKILKPAVEILAGVPTVVYGYFALITVTPILQTFIPGLSSFNALSPGLVMGVMILPTIASISEDALQSVPVKLREASYGLGATKVSTIIRVVIPSAFSGIGAAVILGLARAIGETMIVVIAAGQQPNLTADPREAVATMTTYIVQVSKGDTPTGTLEYRTIFAVGMALFVMTFVINLLSQRLARRYRNLE
jgi:phosphate transport system permease protein